LLAPIGVRATNLVTLRRTARDLGRQLSQALRGGNPIQVRFWGNPGRWQDALAILSEGHVRCLGLAILLAKNIKLGLPTLLLDDAVNAIDHYHREGIRTTLFGHPELAKKQLIRSERVILGVMEKPNGRRLSPTSTRRNKPWWPKASRLN
jgi:hypothetical protein